MCPIQFARSPRVARRTDPVVARFLERRPLVPRELTSEAHTIQTLVGAAGACAIGMGQNARFTSVLAAQLSEPQRATLTKLTGGAVLVPLAECLPVFEQMDEVLVNAAEAATIGTLAPTDVAPTILADNQCLTTANWNRLAYVRRMLALETPIWKFGPEIMNTRPLQQIVARVAHYVAAGVVRLADDRYEPILSALLFADAFGHTQIPATDALVDALCSFGYFGVLRGTGRANEALDYPPAVVPFADPTWAKPTLGDISLKQCGIPTGPRGILVMVGIKTLGALCGCSVQQVFKKTHGIHNWGAQRPFRGFGKAAFVAVRRSLGAYGLALRDTPILWPVADLPGLDRAIADALSALKIHDIDQLCRRTRAELQERHGFHPDAIEAIECAVAAVGRRLGVRVDVYGTEITDIVPE